MVEWCRGCTAADNNDNSDDDLDDEAAGNSRELKRDSGKIPLKHEIYRDMDIHAHFYFGCRLVSRLITLHQI